ncbi:type II toxin-antitoxin system VapC family toxin [Candidatus Bathyarchaeota archaeon]|nr:type II toxin-antitoxin system VapC family toxin [Candidatus Bathyarchaeota archaeon]
MNTIVLDASVVAKWYIAEDAFEKAIQIRDAYLSGKLSVYSPTLLIYEIGNILTRHPSFTSEDSAAAFKSLLDLGLNLKDFTEPQILEKSFGISRQLQVTFYDATYVALAKEYDAKLITADEGLHNRIKEYCNSQLLSEVKLEELIG